MIGIFDVAYNEDRAVVGGVVLSNFAEQEPTREFVLDGGDVGPYVPGEFFRRELPPLLIALEAVPELSVCVVDAYVDLGPDATPGLGRLPHDKVGIPVIGVAKSRYPGTPSELEVLRGSSARPLFVSAAGIDGDEARDLVRSMAGEGRVPAMIRRADRLCQDGAAQL